MDRLAMILFGIPDLRHLRQRPALPEAIRVKFSVNWLREFGGAACEVEKWPTG